MQAPTVKCRDSEIPPTGESNDPTEKRYQTKSLIYSTAKHYAHPFIIKYINQQLKMSAKFKAY